MSDYKWQCQMKAEEIAQKEYDKEFYELSDDLQHKVFTEAMESVRDSYCAKADHLRDQEWADGFRKQQEENAS